MRKTHLLLLKLLLTHKKTSFQQRKRGKVFIPLVSSPAIADPSPFVSHIAHQSKRKDPLILIVKHFLSVPTR